MPTPGFFELYPMARPALPAGNYVLAADHDLVATPPHDADGTLAVDGSDFTFKILSPRFTMPPDQILSTFPPASAVGDWRERLPQIVFKRRTLPWERNPDKNKPFDDDTPPWLALVVLAEGEATLSGDVPVSECVTPGVVLDGDADTQTGKYLEVRASIVQKIFPTPDDLPLLCHVRKVDLSDTELALGDDDGYLAVVLSNRLPQPGPAKEEGGELTSVRYTAYLLNLEGQLDVLPKQEQSENTTVFVQSMPELLQAELFAGPPSAPLDTIVMQGVQTTFGAQAPAANALAARAPAAVDAKAFGAGPPSGVTAYAAPTGVEQAAASYATGPTRAVASADDAHAVRKWASGTGLTELAELAGQFVRLEKTYRFPVLTSWDFVCTGDGGFERLMNELDSGMLGTVDESTPSALTPEIALTGHVTLAHTTRRGESTESWYRGPLVPQPTERAEPGPDGALPLAHTGDQLRRVVPDGKEDVSLASAFEIGRLLSLSKPGIVAGMLSWREDLFGAARVQRLGAALVGEAVAGLPDALLAGKRTLDDLIASRMLVPYAEAVPDRLGPRARSFPTARVPAAIAQMDASHVLAGMAIDPQALQRAVKTGGLAGLGNLAVRVEQTPTTPLSASPTELHVVRAAFEKHLDQLATETLAGAKGAAPGVASRHAGDALDQALDAALTRAREGEG
jgi:hypothetical protein